MSPPCIVTPLRSDHQAAHAWPSPWVKCTQILLERVTLCSSRQPREEKTAAPPLHLPRGVLVRNNQLTHTKSLLRKMPGTL